MTARPPTSTMAADKPKAVEIPEIIVDPNSKRRYERGRFLGKVISLQICGVAVPPERVISLVLDA